jgi:hypothetical protein
LLIIPVVFAGPVMAKNGTPCVTDAQCVPGYCAKSSFGGMGTCAGGYNNILNPISIETIVYLTQPTDPTDK